MARTPDPMAKANLLRAARQEFATVGLMGARVEDIAKRAQLGKGSFYLHFKTKDDAFVAIVDSFFSELGRWAEGCKANTDNVKHLEDVREFLRAQDEQMLEFLWANRDILGIINGSSAQPQYAHILEAFIEGQAQEVSSSIRKMQGKGIYRKDVDPDLCGLVLVGSWHELTSRLTKMKSKPDIKLWVDTLLKIFMDGLRSR